MTETHHDGHPWVIFMLDGGHYAVSAKMVKSLVKLEGVNAMPNQPPFIRGIMNLRGAVIPMLDLRARLNLKSMADEVQAFWSMMDQRRADHERWLGELRKSTEESRAFTLTTNPHQCAFGKWYDAYKPKDPMLAQLLRTFDEPHKRIHAIAHQVEECKSAGRTEEALEIIQRCWDNELKMMGGLFQEVKLAYQASQREIALILDGERPSGLIVDDVIAVEQLREEAFASTLDLMPNQSDDQVALAVGKRRHDSSLVLILQEPERLFSEEAGA